MLSVADERILTTPEPFLQTLRLLSAGGSRLSLRTLKTLETFIIPTGLEVSIAPACPHCPALVVLRGDLASS